jgi:hypothetical protein
MNCESSATIYNYLLTGFWYDRSSGTLRRPGTFVGAHLGLLEAWSVLLGIRVMSVMATYFLKPFG